MAMSDEDHDVYVSQLQEVFDSCDMHGDGKLDRHQLAVLCGRLHLEEQTEALTKKLIGDDPKGTVTFNAFKEGFVAVLAQGVDELEETSEEDDPSTAPDLSDEGENMSPKLVKGSKKYGRRSRPVGASSVESYNESPQSISKSSPSKKSPNLELEDDMDEFDVQDMETPETFEAEGQLNQSIGEMENALDPVSEEEHLRAIWRDLGVGTGGYLTLNELATVCDHIGMDEMNPEEIQHLFDKLDVDSDGRVSFNEFLHGLFQHGGPLTPSATPSFLSRPQSTPRQKLKISVAPSYEGRPQTPSFIGTISGLFSTIDVDGSGYASADALVELWEKLGVPHGMEILDYLQFDSHTKISLAELSSALEQEMRTVEEDNAIYRAAVVSYQHELKHLKTISDTAVAERDKLKQDLSEANQRTALIIKEGDERQAASDQKHEKELTSVESKYQDQIRALQAQIDGEQEALSMQSAHQRTRLENEVTRLKEEEVKLRDKLNQTQRELERLENDILEMAGKCADLEKLNTRQQDKFEDPWERELEDASSLKSRLEELESNQAQIAEEQNMWMKERLDQLEAERNGLKDKNDELTIEVEELKQQLATNQRKNKAMKPTEPGGPSRSGSILSDYQKPPLIRRGSDTVSSEDEELSLSSSGKVRRKLPLAPGLFAKGMTPQDKEALEKSIEKLENEKEELKGTVERLEQEQERLKKVGSERDSVSEENVEDHIDKLTRNFSIERKDLEESYKLEIADLEEDNMREKERLMDTFEKEKVALREEQEEDMRIQAEEIEDELRKMLEEEKRDILIKVESEKNYLKQQLNEERAAMKESVVAELGTPSSGEKAGQGELRTRIAELDLQAKLKGEEMRLEFNQEKRKMKEEYEVEKSSIHNKYRHDISNLENSIAMGREGLRGKLRDDFDHLLDQHKAQIIAEEQRKVKTELMDHQATLRQLSQEKDKLLKEYKQHSEEMVDKHRVAVTENEEELGTAIQDAEKRHRAQMMETELAHDRHIAEVKKEHAKLLEELSKRHEEEQMALEGQLAKTCEELISAQSNGSAEKEIRRRLERVIEDNKEKYEETIKVLERRLEDVREEVQIDGHLEDMKTSIESDVQARLEDNFLAQIERLREAYSEERTELELQISLLKNELDEQSMQQIVLQSQHSIQLDSSFKEQLESMNKINEILHSEKAEMESRLREQLKNQAEQFRKQSDELKRQSEELKQQSEELRVIVREGERLKEKGVRLERELMESERREVPVMVVGGGLDRAPSPLEREESQAMKREQLDLVQELEVTASRVVELETSLSLVRSEHEREIRDLKESMESLVPSSELHRLQADLNKTKLEAGKFKKMWEQRASETNKIIQGSSESHRALTKKIEEERDDMKRKLEIKQDTLDNQIRQLRDNMQTTNRRDLLIKDLYVENANLIKSLYESEKKEKEVNSRASSLQARCDVLQVIVQKVTQAALSG